MGDEPFREDVRKIIQEKHEADLARQAKEKEARAAADARLRDARVKARAILDNVIIPDVAQLGGAFGESEKFRGWSVRNGQREVDNLSQTLSYDVHLGTALCPVRGAIDVGVSAPSGGKLLKMSVHCVGAAIAATSTEKARVLLNEEHDVDDSSDTVGIRGWYQQQLKECVNKLWDIGKD
jgi:hypothetical protein